MGEGARTVCFWTTGEFVTTTARNWFWAENRPYKKVEEFLLGCMSGTDTPRVVLLGYVKDILLGRRMFIGNTRDDSYCLVADDTNIQELYSNMKLLFPLADMERFLEANIRNQEYDEKREQRKEFWPDEYGWLDPNGRFYPVAWAHHQEWAQEYIEKNYSHEEFYRFMSRLDRTNAHATGCAGDFLVFSKDWILLHSPHQGLAQMTHSEMRPFTKAQKEFLYDYFLLRDRPKDANDLYREDK